MPPFHGLWLETGMDEVFDVVCGVHWGERTRNDVNVEQGFDVFLSSHDNSWSVTTGTIISRNESPPDLPRLWFVAAAAVR